MALRYIDSFLALAKYGNFSDAAVALYTSQSSLSKNIKKIENELQVKLFYRSMTGASLTPYGKIYLKYALQIKDLESRCNNTIKDLKAKQSTLKIGTIPSASEYGILNLIFDFTKHENIKCQISNLTSSQWEKGLLNGTLDLAFIKNPENKKLSKENFKHDHLVAVISEQNPLSQRKQIKITDLKNEDFILEPVNSRPYKLCLSLCQQAGFKPNVIYADHFIENIVDFVNKDLGVALLMSKLINPNMQGIKAIPVVPAVSAQINLCFLNNHVKDFEKEKFINYIKNC